MFYFCSMSCAIEVLAEARQLGLDLCLPLPSSRPHSWWEEQLLQCHHLEKKLPAFPGQHSQLSPPSGSEAAAAPVLLVGFRYRGLRHRCSLVSEFFPTAKCSSSLNHWMGQEEKMWFDLDCIPLDAVFPAEPTLAAVPPCSPLRAAKESLCHQLVSALSPATPKMVKE